MAPTMLSTITTSPTLVTTAPATLAAAEIPSATPQPVALSSLEAALPKWFVGITLAWLGIFFTLAATCLLAQFPGLLTWDKIFDNKVSLDERERTARRRREHGRPRASSTALAHLQTDFAGFRKRKPRGLSIDTGARGVLDGLGIDVLEANSAPQVKKRVFFDPTVTVRERSSLTATTAPLPHTRTFLHSPLQATSSFSDDEVNKSSDIEMGRCVQNGRDIEDHSEERPASPHFRSVAAGGEAVEGVEGRGWLRYLNRGVYKIADGLAAMLYDNVESAEGGLLLPVREQEREG